MSYRATIQQLVILTYFVMPTMTIIILIKFIGVVTSIENTMKHNDNYMLGSFSRSAGSTTTFFINLTPNTTTRNH